MVSFLVLSLEICIGKTPFIPHPLPLSKFGEGCPKIGVRIAKIQPTAVAKAT